MKTSGISNAANQPSTSTVLVMGSKAATVKRFVIGDGSSPRSRIDAPLGQVLFFVAFGVWLAARILWNTWYVAPIAKAMPLDSIRTFCLVLLLVRETIYGRRDLRSLAGFIIAAALAATALFVNHNVFFDGICFIFAARDISFKRIACFAFVEMAVLVSFVIVTALFGFTTDALYGGVGSKRGTRHALGFGHPNTAPAFSVFAFFLWAYLRNDRYSWGDAAGMLAIEGFLFYLTNSRSAFFLTALLVVLMMAFRYAPASWDKTNIVKVLSIGSILIVATFTIVLSVIYNPEIGWMEQLSSLLSGRIQLSHEALQEYGIPLLGQDVTFGGASNYNRFTGEWVTSTSTLIVDCMYIRIPVQCGHLFFLSSLALCTATTRQLYKQNQLRVLAIIWVIALYGMVENCSSYLYFDIFLFLLALPLAPPSQQETADGIDSPSTSTRP